MFSFRAPVITIGVILDVVIVKVTIVICITRDVARDNPVEVSGAVTRIRRGRGWSGQLSGGRKDVLWNSHLTTIFHFVLVCYCLALWTIL